MVVAARARQTGRHAVEEERAHLGFGKGTAHPIPVEDRPATERGKQERQHRLDAADLHGHEGGEPVADRARYGSVARSKRAQAWRLLDPHERRAHDGREDRERVGRHLIEVDHPDGSRLHEDGASNQLAVVRVAPATAREEPRTERERGEVRHGDVEAHGLSPASAPTTFARTRSPSPAR